MYHKKDIQASEENMHVDVGPKVSMKATEQYCLFSNGLCIEYLSPYLGN